MHINKLKDKIKENGLNVEGVAKRIGMNKSTFYRKMKKDGFTIKEANDIKATLKLTTADAIDIFFGREVA